MENGIVKTGIIKCSIQKDIKGNKVPTQKDIKGNKAPTQEELIIQYKEQIRTLKYEVVNLKKQEEVLIKVINQNRKRGNLELELIKLQDIYKNFSKNIEDFIQIRLKRGEK